ncbi:MAG: sodium-translocating pyrophosphatase [Candidatus Omnitrophica bacterium CG11_big_fil_rev_8_21_14_0_20_45_26]|uniref:Putative K(+)-stimulated pyrophosphate-energized sodium pump n=1 Tax=Candidatus Abzuiibacterium crystallinum TaxID=1974748 RepID=A0A2H0LM91_9BACT|nr:MAG: sodium-translocating pyrophosphatase [Candidatus Omnitrophica bacterium CG11_big_fil_rev_8_21_14_0_20_45_26]PIW63732.1 MAG: sodium-translocating pyrophosphatase [Candidatus Omnitrophica bacterium CG12_big_fil_rev_8_21_14_0_65_45_16]
MQITTDWLAVSGLLSGFLALGFSVYLMMRIFWSPDGNERMRHIANAVKVGARAYLRRQYIGVSVFFTVVFIILLYLSSQGYFLIFVPFAFLIGGLFSALAGYIGMTIATSSSSRTAHAAITSLNQALRVAFSGGAVMGFTVVGLGVIYVTGWYFALNHYFMGSGELTEADRLLLLSQTILPFGIGASSQALFARVGGGIFTKAADVGADLVGKVEAGIPEDDPRNPAVIADNVGDCVGDVAGMGADLFESYIGSIIAAVALSVSAGFGLSGMLLPIGIAACGILASIIGFFFVRTKETVNQGELLKALRSGVIASSGFIVLFSFFMVRHVMGAENIGIFWAIVTGLVVGLLISFATEYFTSDTYGPTRSISESAQTGPATVIIRGLGVGFLSTAPVVIFVAVGILAAFYFSGGKLEFEKGLYGIAIAAVGMLSTLGITLASDAYGPIADNAGGNAQMANLDPKVRERTDALDSLGNTTAATGKGFAIGSAALTALALVVAYRDLVIKMGFQVSLSITNPNFIVGLFIGAMLPFVFCALTMDAVGRAAQQVVVEVRRQFKEIKGLLEGKAEADNGRCVDIVTKAAQKEMVLPSILALLAPAVIGWLFGVEATIGLLLGSIVCGFVLAIMMASAGGAWDNAKKHIEAGNFGGKGSSAHKAAVVGDTVGDPFKDTAGPSLNILIKLMSMVAIVLASFVAQNHLF